MRRLALVSPMLLVSLPFVAGGAFAQSTSCGALMKPQPLPVQPTLLPSLAPELAVPSHQLGAPTGVLSQAFDEAQSVDQVLFRLRLEGCRSVADALPAPSPAGDIIDPATYKPKTEFDNTPWRFNMSQNGKQMTADEFSAWMKARGVRVARGAAPVAAAPATAPGDLPDPPAPATQPAASPQTPPVPAADPAPATPAPATQVPGMAPGYRAPTTAPAESGAEQVPGG